MIRFNKERSVAVFYTCGLCNLNCRYCTIDKNPVLKDVDKELEESFKGDYYFERLKQYFPRRDMLKRVETWGGEPFLAMDRIYPLIHKIIDYYPYFKCMFSSTNFSYDEWLDQFMGLMNIFAQYPDRQFEYILQLSVDGPEYINDANRGAGVTRRCIANFDKLLQLIKNGAFPQNVILTFSIKGTWDIDCYRKLNDKEKLIEFFKFYEDAYIDKVNKLGNPNIICGISIPNTAIPAPTTKEDGQIFAEVCKKCREIEKENRIYHYFKYYQTITPFSFKECPTIAYKGNCCGCSSGQGMVGFLPNNMISACHEGFTLIADEYKKFAAKRSDEKLTVTLNNFFEEHPTPMCLTDDQYIKHENKMEYINPDSETQMASAVTTIIALAMAGQIEQQYLDERKALDAAINVLMKSSYCIKANYMITGSFAVEPFDLYKLFLNGALKYIKDENDIIGGCNGHSCNTCGR